MTEYRLGRSIAMMIPFHRTQIEKPIITNKILIIFAIVVIAKIAVLMT